MIDRSPRRMASEIDERWIPGIVLVMIALVVAIAAIRNTQWAVGGPVLLGLLGTTASDDSERDLGRVTDAVEGLTRGEYDVDVPTDGDGEIGRLSESVRALADELRERDRTAERRRAFADDLLDAVDDVFYVLDREGYHRRWNESLTRVTGYSDEEIAEMHVLDAFRESDHDAIERTIQDVFETGSGYVRVDYRTKGGRFRPYEFVANRIEAPDGEPLLAGIGRDLSEREGQLRRIRERERQLSTLISNVPGMVYRGRNEPDWPLEFVSDGCRELTGYESERLEEGGDVSWADDVLRGDDEALWEIVQDALAEREPFRVTYPIETAGGERRWLSEQGRGVFDEDGTLEALEGVMIDVTARVENERELERTTHLLEQSQRLANLGVWELDVPSSTVWLSDEVARIAGLSVEEIAGGVDLEEALSFYHPEDRPQIRRAVERAIEADEPYDLELRLLTGDDDQRWVHTIGEPVETDGEIVALRGSIQDVTEREERERELERTAGLLEQAERLAGSGGWALDLQSDPPETTMTDGLRELYELPPESDVEPQAGLDLPLPEDRPRVREALEAAMEHGESWDIGHRMETFQGAERWVRSVGEAVLDGEGRDSADGRTEPDDGEVVALRGSIQDITEHKERELALESLHDSARDLLGTDSRRDAAELVVETAGDVLDVDGVALYVLDDETNELDPVAYTPGFVECCGPATPVPVGAESPLWTAFATGTRTAVDDPASIERSTAFGDEVDRALLVPIGDHGMFTAVASETSITDASRRLVETLAATAEAAFDRLESEANLRERDAELAARNRRLERQIRITEIIRSIDQSLVDADSRAEIERTVCEGLVEADGIAFAWIGAVDGSGDGLDPRAWAGDEEPYLDAVSLEPGSSAEPAVTAARRNATTVVPNVVDRLTTESWRREALGRGFQSVVAVPLAYEDYAYGVLSVYADDPDAFADLERTVFAELGEGIASAINAVWTREALHEAAYTELTLRLEGTDDVLSRIARLAACRVEYEGLGAFAGDATVLFVSFPDADPDGVAAALSELVAIDEYRRIGRGDGQSRYELTVSGDVVPVRLVRHGATLRSMVADETGTEVVVDVPAATDVRGFVGMLRDRYGNVELRGRRDVQRDARAEGAPAAALFDELTPRQLEVLRTAYFAGFFEWPRESTGQEVAEMLGVSQPTVNRHLRLGQGRLLAQLFERTARVGPIER